jgi:hypothetical protein
MYTVQENLLMISKYLSITTFIASLAIGLFIVYIWGPEEHVVYVYPTPDNANRIQYKDNADNCFTFNSTEVDCPTDDGEISKIPIQK